MEKKVTLRSCFQTEGVNYPEEITANITPELLKQIAKAQKLIKKHQFISSITVRDVELTLPEDVLNEMDENIRIGYSGIKVFANGWYWETQGKYDSSFQSEYEAEVL